MDDSRTLPAALEILDRLISFDTTSALSNLPLVDYVRHYLGSHGVDAHLDVSPEGNNRFDLRHIGLYLFDSDIPNPIFPRIYRRLHRQAERLYLRIYPADPRLRPRTIHCNDCIFR